MIVTKNLRARYERTRRSQVESLETAGKMLQIAMDSKNAKVDKKLRMIDLQIRKLRIDAMEGTNSGDPTVGK